MARLAALPEAIVPLGVKQPCLIKTGQMKLMVHISGQDKVIPASDQFQQVSIRLAGCHIVTIIVDMSAPPGPVFLRRRKRIKAAGIHVSDTVLFIEVREILQKALTAIGQTSRDGQAGTSPDEDGVCALYFRLQSLDFL